MSHWVNKTAIEQIAALKDREVTASELLELTIERCELISETINPFALALFDRARAVAKKSDKLLQKGKGGLLCGLPVSVKDSQWMAGIRCANGSPSLVDFIPSETCTAIEQLEDAGAVIFAKTTCPEFCLSGTTNSPLYGPTFNPWDVTKTPGGSSGGAAASVAAGAGSLSLGGDGGGSIRIPAAFCGIVGFKPSHGAVTRRPGFTTWDSLVAYGPMCRSVADARLMFSIIANRDNAFDIETQKPIKTTKVIVSEDLGFAPVDSAVRNTFRQVIEGISSTELATVAGNPSLPSSVVTWATIATHDMWQHKGNTESEIFQDPGVIGDYAKEFIAFGSSVTEPELEDAQSHRTAIYDAYINLFKRHRSNILITPTLGCEAFHHTELFPKQIENIEITYPWLDWAGFLYDANLVGMPSCCIPMGLGENGLPLSLQVVGAPGADLEVLDVAEKIEDVIQWQFAVAPEYDDKTTPIAPPVAHASYANFFTTR